MCRATYAFWPEQDTALFQAALAACAEGGLLAGLGEEVYSLVEDDVTICLDALKETDGGLAMASGGDRPLIAWPQGRVFGPAGELRWRRREGWLHAVLITEAEGALPEGFGPPLSLLPGEPASHLLWGERKGRAWRDGRIPDDLHYPVSSQDGERVRLGLWQYRDERGAVTLSRYTGLTTEEA